MASYTYLLSYNPYATAPSALQIQIFVSQNRDIESWFVPFPGTYMFKSQKPLSDLVTQFTSFFAPSLFLLTWAPPGGVTGAQSADVWNWVNSQPHSLLPSN